MKYFLFRQNNSFGAFDFNENVGVNVVIVAASEREAIEKAEEVGCYWNGVADGYDCECCGDRWIPVPMEVTLDEIEGQFTIVPQENCDDMIIHFPDRKKVKLYERV